MVWLVLALIAAQGDLDTRAADAIRASVARTHTILMASDLDDAERQRRLYAESEAMTDWGAIARGAAAHQWDKMNTEERTRFETALHTLLMEAHLRSLGRFDPAYRVKVVGTERHREDAVWVDLELSGLRFINPRFGFLVNDRLQVIDARLWSVRLVEHLRGTIDRYVALHDLETLLKQIERRASLAKRRSAWLRGSQDRPKTPETK